MTPIKASTQVSMNLEDATQLLDETWNEEAHKPSQREKYQCAWAHSPDVVGGTPHLLTDHLNGTAKKASLIGEKIGYPAITYTLGLLHDSGKQSDEFQRYIKKGVRGANKVDHKNLGGNQLYQHIAQLGISETTEFAWSLIAPIIGHHGSMPNHTTLHTDVKPVPTSGSENPLASTREDTNGKNHHKYLDNTILISDLNGEIKRFGELHPLEQELFTRFFLSALVDADWTDTGDFYRPPEEIQQPTVLRMPERLKEFNKWREEEFGGKDSGKISTLRSKFYDEAVKAAVNNPPGLSTLGLPTGAGKTITGFAYALNHAVAYKMERIIIAAPYNNILSQNALEYRKPFEDKGKTKDRNAVEAFIFEDFGGSEDQEKYGKSNWENPFILTSFVKLLEMLHSNKPSTLRPLHNIVGSVIILDEIQSLPTKLSGSTVNVLDTLVKHFKCSIVFSTGTDPHFCRLYNENLAKAVPAVVANDRDVRDSQRNQSPKLLHDVVEIVNIEKDDWSAFECRVKIDYTEALDTPRFHVLEKEGTPETWFPKTLVDGIIDSTENTKDESILVIVNTVKRATTITSEALRYIKEHHPKMESDLRVICLTTKQTKYDRDRLLSEIRTILSEGTPLLVISTQLIEAGVNVDFASGWREIAPIPSIEQAGGRINREGRREKCFLRVIRFSDSDSFAVAAPSYLGPVKTTIRIIDLSLNTTTGWKLGDNRREDNRIFFENHLSSLVGKHPMDPPLSKDNPKTLMQHRESRNFATVDAAYQIIPKEKKYRLVCLPTDNEKELKLVKTAFAFLYEWYTSTEKSSEKWDGGKQAKYRLYTQVLARHTVEMRKAGGKQSPNFEATLAAHDKDVTRKNSYFETNQGEGDAVFLCPAILYQKNTGLQTIKEIAKDNYETTEVF